MRFTAYHVIKDLDDSEIVISVAFDLAEKFSCKVIKSYHSTDTEEDAAIIEIDTIIYWEYINVSQTEMVGNITEKVHVYL